MERKESKTIFIEYSTHDRNEHFMTIAQTLGYHKVIIGRIFKNYQPGTRNYSYKAVDFNGDEIFGTTENLSELKNRFKKHGRFLAEGIIATRRDKSQANMRFPYRMNVSRTKEITTIRERKTEPRKEESKQIINQKGNTKMNNEIEKANDNSLQREYKESHTTMTDQVSPDPLDDINDQNDMYPDSDPFDDEFPDYPDEYSQREMELEEMRANNEERDRDMEIDI